MSKKSDLFLFFFINHIIPSQDMDFLCSRLNPEENYHLSSSMNLVYRFKEEITLTALIKVARLHVTGICFSN